MANSLYGPYKQSLLDSSAPNMVTSNVKEVLVDGADYTIDLTNHDFLADIPIAGRVATSANYAGKSITNGVFDATDLNPTFPTVTGDVSEYVVLIVDSGAEATSPLIGIWDNGTGLPVTPNGGDVNTVHDNGTSKFYKI